MSKKKIVYNNYICLVDRGSPPQFAHNTKGRYRVGAKNPKEAEKILKEAIGFGSVRVYYQCNDILVGYKEAVKEVYSGNSLGFNFGFVFEPVRHATAPIPKKKHTKRTLN